MRTILHNIAFSFKNIVCNDVRNTSVLHPALKTGFGIVLFFLVVLIPEVVFGHVAASSNYDTQIGTLGTTYSWIDCSSGSSIVSGDDVQASIAWPFNFAFYDNIYTTANSLSVCDNGFIRLDGVANTSYTVACNYNLTATATELGRIIAMAVFDGKVGDIFDGLDFVLH